jgi:ankyrin repeat protein
MAGVCPRPPGLALDALPHPRWKAWPGRHGGHNRRLEILRMILATGRANLADTNRYGGPALIPAAHHGHPEVVRELLKTAIDVNHVNRLGWTALLETIILSDGGPVHQEILAQLIVDGKPSERNAQILDELTLYRKFSGMEMLK